MKNWTKILVGPSSSIKYVMKVLDDSSMQIVIVVDEQQRLLGTVTDGDIRRGILKGISVEEPVDKVMNHNPATVPPGEERIDILSLMRKLQLHQIPVVDQNGVLVRLETMDDMLLPNRRENKVVIMAGGVGSRLMPYTLDCPKPMLKVRGKPILESIIERLLLFGFFKFDISVNYKADVIEGYFGDGSRWDIEIKYLKEDKKLGTAGSLGLMDKDTTFPVLVMNGDLVTELNFDNLMNFHEEHGASATICVKEYYHQVPFGVVGLDNDRLTGITEKPMQQHFVNAGIYVLEKDVIDAIPNGQKIEMTELFQKMIDKEKEIKVFPIWEPWTDVGRPRDLLEADNGFSGS